MTDERAALCHIAKDENCCRFRIERITPITDGRYKLLARRIGADYYCKNQLNAQLSESDTRSENNVVTIVLEGTWARTELNEQSIIHLIECQYNQENGVYLVNNSSGLLVVEPDDLLTCSTLVSSLYCQRKTWLGHIFPARVGFSKAIIIGSLVHDLFFRALRDKVIDRPQMVKYLDEILCNSTVMMRIFSTGRYITYFKEEVSNYLDHINEWIVKYMQSGSKYSLANDKNLGIRILDVCDIENILNSPRYGLKGKVDITGNVRIYDRRARRFRDMISAIEVKTGCSSLCVNHCAQINIYTMMMEDIQKKSNGGFVTYLKDGSSIHHSILNHNIKRDILQTRNQLTEVLKEYYHGPTMLDRMNRCRSCDRIAQCVSMSKLYDNNLDQFPTMKLLEPNATSHLDEDMMQFFKKHYEILVKLIEENSSLKYERFDGCELVGRGFQKLQFVARNHMIPDLVSFSRHPKHVENYSSSDQWDLMGSQPDVSSYRPLPSKITLRPFDTKSDMLKCRVLVSLDNVNFNVTKSNMTIAMGLLKEIRESSLVVKLFTRRGQLREHTFESESLYRIDKIYPERYKRLKTMRFVLAKLLNREGIRIARARRLILDPSFRPSKNTDMKILLRSIGKNDELTEVDSDEWEHIIDALSTDNYFVFTEKFITSRNSIDSIVLQLTRLICSYLHRTVLIVAQDSDRLIDLMHMLHREGCLFILIDDGKSKKAQYQFADHLVKVSQDDSMNLTMKYDIFIEKHVKASVVLTTYSESIEGILFTRRTFDYCIAYDCDTTELLVGVAPMFCSDRCIMFDIRDAESDKRDTMDMSLGNHLRKLRGVFNSNQTCERPASPETINRHNLKFATQ